MMGRVGVKMLKALALLLVLGTSVSDGLTMNKCELMDQLRSNLPKNLQDEVDEVAQLACHAEQTSGFNTSLVKQVPFQDEKEDDHKGRKTRGVKKPQTTQSAKKPDPTLVPKFNSTTPNYTEEMFDPDKINQSEPVVTNFTFGGPQPSSRQPQWGPGSTGPPMHEGTNSPSMTNYPPSGQSQLKPGSTRPPMPLGSTPSSMPKYLPSGQPQLKPGSTAPSMPVGYTPSSIPNYLPSGQPQLKPGSTGSPMPLGSTPSSIPNYLPSGQPQLKPGSTGSPMPLGSTSSSMPIYLPSSQPQLKLGSTAPSMPVGYTSSSIPNYPPSGQPQLKPGSTGSPMPLGSTPSSKPILPAGGQPERKSRSIKPMHEDSTPLSKPSRPADGSPQLEPRPTQPPMPKSSTLAKLILPSGGPPEASVHGGSPPPSQPSAPAHSPPQMEPKPSQLLNITAGNRRPARSAEDRKWTLYGIFQLADRVACSSSGVFSQNLCKLPCEKLTDDDITDDIACVGTIINSMNKTSAHEQSKALIKKMYRMLHQGECGAAVYSQYSSEC